MALTSFTKFVFLYLTIRLLSDGMEEFLIQPTAWFYVRYLGESDLFLGLLQAAFPFGAMIFAPCAGVFDVRFDSPKSVFMMCSVTKFIGNVLYTTPFHAYLPLIGRLLSGLGEGTVGVVYGAIAKGTDSRNRAQAFLYFEGLYTLGTACGPVIGSFFTFNFDVLGLEMNAGNSPGLILATIWFLMIIFTMFLPRELASKSTDLANEESGNESELSPTNDTMQYSISRVCCLYFVIFQSLVLFNIGYFYTPLLAAYHLGLELIDIKLLYASSALSAFLLFLGSYILSSHIAEKSFLAFGIASHIVPLSILFYFAFSFNDGLTANNGYFLLILMVLLSVSFLIFPLSCSLLSKETPTDQASFYQSICFVALHLSNGSSRFVSGATFTPSGMMYVCIGLSVGWIIQMFWFFIEYRAFYPSSGKSKGGEFK
jgi:MFS family permease